MPAVTPLPAAQAAKLLSATDGFIRDIRPAWMINASPAHISALRHQFSALRESQTQVHQALAGLQSPEQYARQALEKAFEQRMGLDVDLDRALWREERRRLAVNQGVVREFESYFVRTPALEHLMQNFKANESFFTQTALVYPANPATGEVEQVVSSSVDDTVALCREVDVGGGYRAYLDKTLNADFAATLAKDMRNQFAFAVQMAAVKGQVKGHDLAMLNLVAQGKPAFHSLGLQLVQGQLTLMGWVVEGALAFDVRGTWSGTLVGIAPLPTTQRVVLYLPDEAQQQFHVFDNWADANRYLAGNISNPRYRAALSRRITLRDRPAYMAKLAKRLSDDAVDVQPHISALPVDLFAGQADAQLRRIVQDAAVLLVPTADADRAAANARKAAFEAVSWTLLGVAGVFVPTLGALMVANMVVHSLGELCEGAWDWSQGHRHEALEHVLGVAEDLAVAGAVALGANVVARGFVRSGFVDGLEPVQLDDQRRRLWSADLTPYESAAGDARPGANGLFASGSRRWIRTEGRFYEVHQPQPNGPWRLLHPHRPEAFGPVVETNGERAWWLRRQATHTWNDSARMLDCLWPELVARSADRAERTLQVAGADKNALRGLLVEQRSLPVNLRVTLRRFEADRRIEDFFEGLRGPDTGAGDAQILQWCRAQPEMAGVPDNELRLTLIADAPRLRGPLLDHLVHDDVVLSDVETVVKRDFPGLGDEYVREVARDLDIGDQAIVLAEGRLPLALSRKARSLLQQVRLRRALEGLHLYSATSTETGELVIALLRRLPHWPTSVNVELREGSDLGVRLAQLDPSGRDELSTRMVLKNGRFRLYDSRGIERQTDVAEPAGVFDALLALLTPQHIQAMGIDGAEPAAGLRTRLMEILPTERSKLLQLLGWRPQAPVFNPGLRLPDGRVGYPLSGRGQAGAVDRDLLRARIRNLYSGMDESAVDTFMQMLLERPASGFMNVLDQEANYEQLRVALNRWISGEAQPAALAQRRQVASRLRRTWRLQGPVVSNAQGDFEGMRLDLSGMRVGRLPVLPADIDFSHVTVLTLVNMSLDDVPVDFLRCFGSLRHLNLGSNNIRQVPAGIPYLVDLRSVRLAHNQIRLGPQGFARLAGLRELQTLDLSFNPLGALQMRYNHLSHIRELNLRHCQLATWPAGLELCGELEHADLRDNLLTSVPEEILQMPLVYRQALMVDRNPLGAADLMALFRARTHPLHGEVLAERLPLDAAATRTLWLDGLPASEHAAREVRWDIVMTGPDSETLVALLGKLQRTSEFRVAHDALREQVWTLLEALESDSELRERIFSLAGQPLSCQDSVIDRFSALRLDVLVSTTEQSAAYHESGSELIELGRSLFRLEQLEVFARRDMIARGEQGRGVDEIEVSLYYRVHLAQRLGLRMQPGSMSYGAVARVSAQQLDDAERFVLGAETDQALAASLSSRDFWQRYLLERHRQVLEDTAAPFVARGSELDDQDSSLTSEAYRQRWDDLKIEQDSAMQAMRVRLTLDLLRPSRAS